MDSTIHPKIQELGDLELAILVCLVAQEHCVFSAGHTSRHDLKDELRLICKHTFGLQPATVDCSPQMTVDQFSEAILVESVDADDDAFGQRESYDRPTLSVDFTSARGRSPSRFGSNMLDERRIADVIIATDLDTASEHVQVQALELIRTKRIFTRTAMHTASKAVMVLALSSKPHARLSLHLNDLFCMSHFHREEDGLHYLGEQAPKDALPSFSDLELKELRTLADEARMTPEIAAYLHNIVVFMRNSRYISGGVTATATRQLRVIAKVLAPLHGLNYVPPSLVALACHKIYPHRLKLATARTERSLQWGSDPRAVERLLEGMTIERAIDDVLASVETPL
jgi:hypothetical protein